MNENRYTYPPSSLQRLLHLLPLLSVLLLLTAACSKKEVEPEPEPKPTPEEVRKLKFNFDSTSQPDADAIREIEVFVFDDQERLIGRTSTDVDGTVVLDYPQTPMLHCVVWGNSKDSCLELSTLQLGDSLKKGYLTLTPLLPTRAEEACSNTPPDLFRGDIKIDNSTTPADQQPAQVALLPTTASVHITIDGLPEATGTESGDYAIEVTGQASRIDFTDNYSGETLHHLTGSFNAKKEYIIPPFHLFPTATGEGITVDILQDGKLLKSFTQASDGKPLLPEAGKEMTLLIKFALSGGIEIEVKPPAWNSTDIEVEVTPPNSK